MSFILRRISGARLIGTGVALVLVGVGLTLAGTQAVTHPGIGAVLQFQETTGTNCMATLKLMVQTPSNLDQLAGDVGPEGAWVVPDVVFVGSPEQAARSLSGTVTGAGPGEAWVNGTDSDIAVALRLIEVVTPAGTRAWVVVERTTAVPCPSGE